MKFNFQRNIIILTIVFYFVFLLQGRKAYGKKVIKIPKLLTVILGNPLEHGKITLKGLLLNISNIISFGVGTIFNFSAYSVIAAKVYVVTLMITLMTASIISAIIERDIN